MSVSGPACHGYAVALPACHSAAIVSYCSSSSSYHCLLYSMGTSVSNFIG